MRTSSICFQCPRCQEKEKRSFVLLKKATNRQIGRFTYGSLVSCTMKENTNRIKSVKDNIKFSADSRTEVISCLRLMTDLPNFHSHPFFPVLPYFITFIIEWRGKESLRGKKVSWGESGHKKIHFRAAWLVPACLAVSLYSQYRQIADPSSFASAVTFHPSKQS